MNGYVVVNLSGGSTIQLPFSQNDTAASLTVPCGCGSVCENIISITNILYTTPTPTSEPLAPTNPPTQCWQYEMSPIIYNSQSECQDAEGGICNEVLCPE
jgi:hypothetical protein